MTKKCKDISLRNAEYYSMLETFDKLHRQSSNGIIFDDLMPLITSEENIRLAYRNIKNNNGSKTSGVDKKTISDIKNMKLDNFICLIQNKFKNYKADDIRRVYIPKSNGDKRPLGIPTITERIIEQCVLQILEPILEAKFHKNSNGFRPNKSTESSLSQFTSYVYRNKCYYIVDVDIKGFFDNVDHGKLIKQLWTLKIRDKKLLKIISIMLKAKIIGIGVPTKGTPQGGILSPLLANVVLNELDWWLSNQWMTYKVKGKEFKKYPRQNGTICSYERAWLRKNTNLKEFYFTRYADDFKIICKSYDDAVRLKIATTKWLKERLNLEVSEEKTKIVNIKRNYSEYLGFKIKVRKKNKKGKRFTIISHISDKAKKKVKAEIKDSLKAIRKEKNTKEKVKKIDKYNKKVIGIHFYYNKATMISIDFARIYKELSQSISKTFKNAISYNKTNSLNNGFIENTYGKSKVLKKLNGMFVVPLSYVQFKKPTMPSNKINKYTIQGRELIHTGLECMDYETIKDIVKSPLYGETVELNDIIIPKCANQYGKCYVSEIKITKNNLDFVYIKYNIRDKDKYQNIIIIDKEIKRLLLSKGRDIMEMKKNTKERDNRVISL